MKTRLLKKLRKEANEKYKVTEMWSCKYGIYMIKFAGGGWVSAHKTKYGARFFAMALEVNNFPPYPTVEEIKDAIEDEKREHIIHRIGGMRREMMMPKILADKQSIINQLNS